MPTHNDDAIQVHLEYLRADVSECLGLLKAQNGRIREAETAIAVLEDRADESKRTGRNWGAGTGAAGGFFGGFVAGLIQRWGGQ